MALADQTLARSGRNHAWFQGLALASLVSVFGLVILGGVVRVTGSGLGCPDWPLCHGGILPPLESKAIIEFSHRFVASILVGPLIIVTCLSAWIFYRHEKWLLAPATLALALLVGQALLGGATVLNELPGSIVMAHLALGQTLLGCITLMTIVAFRGPLHRGAQSWMVGRLENFPVLISIAAVGVFLLLLSGSYVTITGSTGACLDWPLCNGEAFPVHELQAIHMAHRYVALLAGLFVLYSLHLGFRGRTQPLAVRVLSLSAALLFAAQVMAGAGAIWSNFSQELRALHLALATGVWGTIAAVVVLSFTREPSPDTGAPNG